MSDLADSFIDTTEPIVVFRLLAMCFNFLERPAGTFVSDQPPILTLSPSGANFEVQHYSSRFGERAGRRYRKIATD